MGRSTREEIGLSEQRKYRRFTAKRKLEIVVASLRGDRSIAELCREHGIAESLLRKWREQALEAAAERFESGQERTLAAEQRRRIAQLERALGRKTYELEIAGEASHGRFAHPERCKWDAAGVAVRSSAMLRLGVGRGKPDAGVPRHLDLCFEHADQTLE
jgi:transposase